MATPPTNRSPRSGGILLALGVTIGVIGGGLLGQPSLGFLVGLGVAILLVVILWLADRRRTGR